MASTAFFFSPATFYTSSANLRSSPKSPPRFFLPLSSFSPFTDTTSSVPNPSIKFSPSPLCENQNEIALQLPDLKRLLHTLKAAKRSSHGGSAPLGSVTLVGTGPGDPELLTLKAVQAIDRADLILYDRLVSDDLLRLVRGNATLLYVGKTAGYHSRTQEEIHELLLNFAEAGANVVRLKGGDPLAPFGALRFSGAISSEEFGDDFSLRVLAASPTRAPRELGFGAYVPRKQLEAGVSWRTPSRCIDAKRSLNNLSSHESFPHRPSLPLI